MVTLANYPNLDQKQTGRNGWRNCVPTSIDDGLEYLTGKGIGVQTLLDEAYGPNYSGFCAASAFVASCAKRGVKLWHIDGDGPFLVQAVHQQIKDGHPTVATEPDPYAADHPDWSHVISFYREDPGSLTARDPYSTHDVTHTDEQWAKLFEFHQVWAMERRETDVTIDINTPIIAAHFEAVPGGWQVKGAQSSSGNPIILHGAMLAHYQTNGYKPHCGYSCAGLPLTNEIKIEDINPPTYHDLAGQGIVVVVFEREVWVYDPKHHFNPPADAGDVYPLKLYDNGPGSDPRLFTLQAEINQLSTQLQTEQQKVAPADPVLASAASKYADIVKIIQG